MTLLSILFLSLFSVTMSLRCFEGTVKLDSNLRTAEKECGISSYCIQKINKKSGEMRRECASFTDEHNMEERCPMSGCHWQSSSETFCCCQFDGCNEWKQDGSEFKKGETVVVSKTPTAKDSRPTPVVSGSKAKPFRDRTVEVPTTEEPKRSRMGKGDDVILD